VRALRSLLPSPPLLYRCSILYLACVVGALAGVFLWYQKSQQPTVRAKGVAPTRKKPLPAKVEAPKPAPNLGPNDLKRRKRVRSNAGCACRSLSPGASVLAFPR